MIIRCALTGSGTAQDPYRVDLPTYDLVDVLPDGRAIVRVPDHLAPPGFTQEPGPNWQDTPHGLALTKLTGERRDRWLARLSDRYGKSYSPEVR